METDRAISVIALTFSRVHLLRLCVENVLFRTSDATKEIIIWNNASTDDTATYLDSLDDPRLRIHHHPENIGLNAYAEAFRLARHPYLIELDDDIIDAPQNWDRTLLEAFVRLPTVGYLAANLENNPHDVTAQLMYGSEAHFYSVVEENGVRLKVGRTGGGCTMTSREIYDAVGGFHQHKKLKFFEEDGLYIRSIERLGYRAAYLDELEVKHAGGPHYSPWAEEKYVYWRYRDRKRARKDFVKRVLLRIPFVAGLNAKHGWFQPPARRT